MGLCAFAQTPAKEAPPAEVTKGMPPRATPVDYQAQAVLGPVTLAAEFSGHGINTENSALTTEDYVVVEVGVFGTPGTHVKLSADDFQLRINGKKNAETTQPFLTIRPTLKDPEWEPPIKQKSKNSVGADAGGGQGDPPPEPPKMPFAERRAMEQRVLKMTMPEGDRATPVAGLLFFSYRSKVSSIKSLELIYTGPAGKASLNLHP